VSSNRWTTAADR